MNITVKPFKIFLSILLILITIYWTKFEGNKFRSNIEFSIANEFILNDKRVKELVGDVSSVKFIKGETFTNKKHKQAIYQFNIESSLSKKIIVWVYRGIACKGFLVKAELQLNQTDVQKVEEICVKKLTNKPKSL